MPTYEYECVACNIRCSYERSIHDVNVPMCCGFAMRQVYGSIGAIFKGSGWGKDAN